MHTSPGGAGSESTLRENRRVFEKYKIIPRMLRDVSARDISIELFGQKLHLLFCFALSAYWEMAHPLADLAVGNAAASLGIPYIFF